MYFQTVNIDNYKVCKSILFEAYNQLNSSVFSAGFSTFVDSLVLPFKGS